MLSHRSLFVAAWLAGGIGGYVVGVCRWHGDAMSVAYDHGYRQGFADASTSKPVPHLFDEPFVVPKSARADLTQ